jgi:hypothetical protein
MSLKWLVQKRDSYDPSSIVVMRYVTEQFKAVEFGFDKNLHLFMLQRLFDMVLLTFSRDRDYLVE